MEKLFLLLNTLDTLKIIQDEENKKLSRMSSKERIEYTEFQMRMIEKNHPEMVENITLTYQNTDEPDDFEPTNK